MVRSVQPKMQEGAGCQSDTYSNARKVCEGCLILRLFHSQLFCSQRCMLRAFFGGWQIPCNRLQSFSPDLRYEDWCKDTVRSFSSYHVLLAEISIAVYWLTRPRVLREVICTSGAYALVQMGSISPQVQRTRRSEYVVLIH